MVLPTLWIEGEYPLPRYGRRVCYEHRQSLGKPYAPSDNQKKLQAYESQIEPWLASTTTLLACARKLESVVTIKKDESMRREKSKSLAT